MAQAASNAQQHRLDEVPAPREAWPGNYSQSWGSEKTVIMLGAGDSVVAYNSVQPWSPARGVINGSSVIMTFGTVVLRGKLRSQGYIAWENDSRWFKVGSQAWKKAEEARSAAAAAAARPPKPSGGAMEGAESYTYSYEDMYSYLDTYSYETYDTYATYETYATYSYEETYSYSYEPPAGSGRSKVSLVSGRPSMPSASKPYMTSKTAAPAGSTASRGSSKTHTPITSASLAANRLPPAAAKDLKSYFPKVPKSHSAVTQLPSASSMSGKIHKHRRRRR